MKKSIVSLILVFSMLFTMFPVNAISVSQTDNSSETQNTQTDASLEHSDLAFEADNSMGNMISNAMQEKNDLQDAENENHIIELTVEDNVADVSYEVTDDSVLRVDICDEKTEKVITSGVASVDADSQETKVEIDTDRVSMPEHFITKAVILDEKSNEVSSEYVDESNTEWYEEFSEAEVSDFDSDRVINMDESTDNNFAVLNEDVKVIDSTTSNQLTQSNGEYVFTNADKQVKELTKGDIFCYNADDPDNIVIGEITDITKSGSTVIVQTEEPALDEAFDMIKINYEEDQCLMQDLEEGTEPVGADNSGKKSPESVGGSISGGGSVTITRDLGVCEAEFSTSAEVKFEYSITKKYVAISAKIEPSATIKVEIEGKYEATKNIGSFKIPTPVAGLSVKLAFKVKLEATATLTTEVKLEATAGYEWSSNNGKKNLSSKPKITAEVKIEGKFYVGLVIEPTINAVSLADFGFSCDVGAEIKASVSASHTFGETSRHACNDCISGEFDVKLSVAAKIEVDLVVKKIEKKINICTWSFFSFKFYFSLSYWDFGFGECPYKAYKTTFTVVDPSGNPISGARVGSLTTNKSGKASDFFASGAHTVRVSANGYKTKILNFGITSSAVNKTIKMNKGSSSSVETETDASYSAGKAYKVSKGSGSGYGGSAYLPPLQFIEPAEGVVLSTANAYQRRFDTAWVQQELNKLGYSCPKDGYYGNSTANAVRRFQADYFLYVNGVCNLATISMLKYPYKPVSQPVLSLTTPKNIASGGIATVNWNSVAGASEYDVYLYKTDGTLVNSLIDVKGNTASFVCYEVGTYVIKAVSENLRYTSSTASTDVITVHPPLTVTFVDADDTVLNKQLVEYGGSANAPVTPENYGYIFSKWDKSFNKVTSDMTVKAVYTKNNFTVTFVDVNGNIIETQKVPYLESATPPENFEVTSGYKFVGWDKDYTCIKGDTKIRTVVQWENEDLPIIIESGTAVRDGECTGYTVTTVLRNYDKQRTNGRVVVALKTAEGKFLTMTESSAFTLAPSDSSQGKLSKKTIEVFVPYEGVATQAEIYVVETYGDLIPISEKCAVEVSCPEDWTGWLTDAEKPEKYYDTSEPRTEYTYRTKSTTSSGSSSLAGWTKYDTQITSWSAWSGWLTYNPSNGVRNVQWRSAYDHTEYHYYRWTNGSGTYTYKYNSSYWLEETWFTYILPTSKYGSSIGYIGSDIGRNLWVRADYSGNRSVDKTFTRDIYRDEWRYQDPIYTYYYYKWSDWSGWSTTPVSANSTVEVQTRTTRRYRTEKPVEDNSGIERTVSGTIDTSYAGKQLSLFIYKIDDASDYTNEFVGQTVVGEDGSYSFTFKLREEPTAKTGDFTVAVGIEGTNSLMYLDSIEAEKPEYTVQFCDYDGTVIETQSVKEGESAIVPDEIPQRDGYTFVGWDCSNRGIYEDMNITAIYTPKKYTVLYIDWTNELYELKTYYYGDRLIIPEIADTEDAIAVGWDAVINGEEIVTKNMVITAKYETKKYTVDFYDYEGNLIETQTIEHGDSASAPEMSSTADYEFIGWDDSVKLDKITEDIQVYPDFKFTRTTQTPYADVEGGVYNDTVTVSLGCPTENSIIYYSINGGEEKEYTEPFTVSSTAQVDFYASALGYNNSDIMSVAYVINRVGDEENHLYPVDVLDEDGNVIERFIVSPNSNLYDEIRSLSKNGYSLKNVYKNIECTESWNLSSDKVNGATVLYAKWSVNTYTVTFVDENGNVIDTQYVDYMESAVEPECITVADGYVMVGWDTDDYICVTRDMTVKVVTKKENEIVSLNISKNSYTMLEGLSYQLTSIVTGVSNPDIVWLSDDENVIKVDQNGNIIAVSEGVAIVTAYLVGTDLYAQCFITVDPSPLRSICLVSNSDYTLSYGMMFGVIAGLNTVSDITSQLMNMNVVVTDKNGKELSSDNIVGTGAKISVYDDYEEADSVIVIISGDINGDGYINNKDVSMLSRYLVNKEQLSEYALSAADVNADGSVNNRDAALLARYLVGKEKI